jgi:hypothetical protein
LESYYHRPVTQHLQAPKNCTDPMPIWPGLFNQGCVNIYCSGLRRKLEKQGSLFLNFNSFIKSNFRRKSHRPVGSPKGSGIPPQRDTDTNTKVIGLCKHIKRGSYVYHPKHKKVLILRRLRATELVPICQEINAINQYRFMDYVFHLDASCLNDNWADRNKVCMFSGLEIIKRVTSLTHNLQEKVWSWQLEDRRNAREEWARGVKFFPEFKRWALSFSHATAHELICALEGKLDS